MAASGKGLDRAGYVLVVAALVAWRLVAADFGSLRVESDADVEVVWEGVSLGTTNELGTMVIGDIPLGDYTVILKKNGFETRRVSVVVAGGETVLSFKLAAEQPPEKAEVIEPEPRIIEARPPAEQVLRAKPRAAAREPRLEATAEPAAAVKPERKPGNEPRSEPDSSEPASATEAVRAGGESQHDLSPEISTGRLPADEVSSPEPTEAPAEAPEEVPENRLESDNGGSSFLLLLALLLALGSTVGVVVWWRIRLSTESAEEMRDRPERMQESSGPAVQTIKAVSRPTFLRELQQKESELEKTIDVSATGDAK